MYFPTHIFYDRMGSFCLSAASKLLIGSIWSRVTQASQLTGVMTSRDTSRDVTQLFYPAWQFSIYGEALVRCTDVQWTGSALVKPWSLIS